MKQARIEAEKEIIKFMAKFDKSGFNVSQWKKVLAEMSDVDFDDYMVKIATKEAYLVGFAPLFKSQDLTTENALELAKEYNVPMFEQLEVTGDEVPDYITDQKFFVGKLPLKAMSQTQEKKVSVPDDNKTVDLLTGQPTGESKGSSLSQPENNVMNSMGLKNSIAELTRPRGGDKGAWRAYNAMALRLGRVSLEGIDPFRTGVESTKVVEMYLAAMHLRLRGLWD